MILVLRFLWMLPSLFQIVAPQLFLPSKSDDANVKLGGMAEDILGGNLTIVGKLIVTVWGNARAKNGANHHAQIGLLDTMKAGIQRDMAMTDKLMYIPNYDTQNYHFCKLKLVVETFKHST